MASTFRVRWSLGRKPQSLQDTACSAERGVNHSADCCGPVLGVIWSNGRQCEQDADLYVCRTLPSDTFRGFTVGAVLRAAVPEAVQHLCHAICNSGKIASAHAPWHIRNSQPLCEVMALCLLKCCAVQQAGGTGRPPELRRCTWPMVKHTSSRKCAIWLGPRMRIQHMLKAHRRSTTVCTDCSPFHLATSYKTCSMCHLAGCHAIAVQHASSPASKHQNTEHTAQSSLH